MGKRRTNSHVERRSCDWACSGLAAGDAGPCPGGDDDAGRGRGLCRPFYAALADAGTADIGAVLSAIAVPDYRSYASNETGTPAAAVAAGLNGFGTAVPDLDWRVVEVIPADGKIIVRGEATGTPVAPLFGVPPSGQSFRIMSIDIWTVAGGKLVSIHHVEDWATGIRQLSGG